MSNQTTDLDSRIREMAGRIRALREIENLTPEKMAELTGVSTEEYCTIASQGIYPAVDPLDSTSRILSPDVVGEEHYEVARGVQKILQRYNELQDIIAIMGIDELSEEEKSTNP